MNRTTKFINKLISSTIRNEIKWVDVDNSYKTTFNNEIISLKFFNGITEFLILDKYNMYPSHKETVMLIHIINDQNKNVLFNDLDINDFTSPQTQSYVNTYTHKFNPILYGFVQVTGSNFYRNVHGDIRYFLKMKNTYTTNHTKRDVWTFKVVDKNNNILHREEILDSEILSKIPKFLRKEVIKEFIDEL